MSRVDLASYKSELNFFLQDKKEIYWDSLRKYLKGKISRVELDKIAKSSLGDNLHLHNKFIIGIFRNAQPQIQPPPDILYEKLFSGKRRHSLFGSTAVSTGAHHKLLTKNELQERKFRRSLLNYLSSDQTEKLLREANNTRPNYSEFRRSKPVFQNQTFAQDFEKGYNQPTCSEVKFLPDLTNLRLRMNSIARQEQLTSNSSGLISDESILLLYSALQYYLKTAISTCLEQTTCGRSRGVLARFDLKHAIDHPLLRISVNKSNERPNLRSNPSSSGSNLGSGKNSSSPTNHILRTSPVDNQTRNDVRLKDFYFSMIVKGSFMKLDKRLIEKTVARVNYEE